MDSSKYIIKKSSDSTFDINSPKIIYADIETVLVNNVHKPIALGYTNLDGSVSNLEIIPFENFLYGDKFLEVLEQFVDKASNSVVYFHNLSSFDGFLLLNSLYKILPPHKINFIERNNKIYRIELETIVIKDSYLLFPNSLKKLTSLTNLFYQKWNFNYSTITKIWLKKPFYVKMILKNDVLCLHESFIKLSGLLLSVFSFNTIPFLTLPSLTLNMYLINFYKQPVIFKNNYVQDSFFRNSYFGGLTELYKPLLKNGFHYDVNSLYPTVMNLDMPVGISEYFKKPQLNEFFSFFGIAEVEIITPHNLYIPLLPKHSIVDGIVTGLGNWKAVYFSEELKAAVSLGYRVKILKSFRFRRGKIFYDFVNEIYSVRSLFVLKKHPLNKISKYLLNSLYGRFGMKLVKHSKSIVNFNELHFLKNNFLIKDLKFMNFGNLLVNKEKINIESSSAYNVAVHIAASVTSYSRIFIYRYKTIPHNSCVYSDTDSVFLTKRIPKYCINFSLGGFKKISKLKFSYFLSLKSYLYITNLNQVGVKFKGLNVIEKNKLVPSFFYNVIKNKGSETLNLKQKHVVFKKQFSFLSITHKKYIANFKVPFDKRFKKYL